MKPQTEAKKIIAQELTDPAHNHGLPDALQSPFLKVRTSAVTSGQATRGQGLNLATLTPPDGVWVWGC